MEQKTELPTHKKKEDSAKKGQVFLSRDFVGFIILVGVAGFVWLCIDGESLTYYFDLFEHSGFDMAIGDYTRMVAMTFFRLVGSIVGVSLFIAIFSTLIQTRFHLASEAIRIDFEHLNPVSGFKEIFSLRTVKDSLKSIFYLFMAIVGFIVFAVKYHPQLFTLPWKGIDQFIVTWRDLLPPMVCYMLLPLFVVIAFDALAEFFLYIKDLMMSKQEVKQEYKNNEGDPQIKGRRKSIHKEILSGQTKADIRQSKFILANPTHIACGIYFNPAICHLPLISVLEKNAKAVAVIRYAEKHGLPVIRNIKLARSVFKKAKQYQFVDNENIVEIMQIIVWLEQVENAWKNELEPDVEQTVTPEEDRDSPEVSR